jgi:hypothetical protein
MSRPDRIVQIGGMVGGNWYNVSYPDYLEVARSQRTLECLSASAWDYLDLGRVSARNGPLCVVSLYPLGGFVWVLSYLLLGAAFLAAIFG